MTRGEKREGKDDCNQPVIHYPAADLETLTSHIAV